MKLFSGISLAKKLLGIEMGVLCIILTPTTILEIKESRNQIRNETEDRISKTLEGMVNNLRRPLWNYSTQECNEIIKTATNLSLISNARLYNSAGLLITEAKDEDYIPKINNTHWIQEIQYNEKTIGKVDAIIDNTELNEKLAWASFNPILRNLIATLLIGLITHIFMRKILITRILNLESEAKNLSEKLFKEGFKWENEGDEIDSLGKSLNGARLSLRSAFTKIKSTGAELQKLNQHLEETVVLKTAQAVHNSRLASLGEMSAGIAHEINNPLAIIDGTVRVLHKFTQNPEIFKKKTDTVEKAIQRISKIVSGLRKFSRTSDQSEYKMHSIKKIVEESLVLTEAKSRRFNTPVEVNCETDAHIQCNEIEIEQVFVNLINNGIDAVKNQNEKWIKIELLETELSIILKVRDSGHGIPEIVEKKLFQPFFTTKVTGEGTGLGLSIVKGILEEHEASIHLNKNDPNTCFEIHFKKNREQKHAA